MLSQRFANSRGGLPSFAAFASGAAQHACSPTATALPFAARPRRSGAWKSALPPSPLRLHLKTGRAPLGEQSSHSGQWPQGWQWSKGWQRPKEGQWSQTGQWPQDGQRSQDGQPPSSSSEQELRQFFADKAAEANDDPTMRQLIVDRFKEALVSHRARQQSHMSL